MQLLGRLAFISTSSPRYGPSPLGIFPDIAGKMITVYLGQVDSR